MWKLVVTDHRKVPKSIKSRKMKQFSPKGPDGSLNEKQNVMRNQVMVEYNYLSKYTYSFQPGFAAQVLYKHNASNTQESIWNVELHISNVKPIDI